MPFRQLWPVLGFLALWAACAYVTFLICIPAVSFTGDRMKLPYWGPLFLLFSIISAAIARALVGRASILLASVVMVGVFVCTGHSLAFRIAENANWAKYRAIFQEIDGRRLAPESRLYAFPNTHLVLTFYSGLPIQDITPVRKCFLDKYPGEILLIDSETGMYTDTLSPEHIRNTAGPHGVHLSEQVAGQWSALLTLEPYRERIRERSRPESHRAFIRYPSSL